MPFKSFTSAPLASADVNTYLMKQAVMVFATSTARAAAITSPSEGMVTYISDTDRLETYSGSAWVLAVNTASIQDNAVTTGKINANAVTPAKLQSGMFGVSYADVGVTMSTSYVQRTVTIPAGKNYTDVVAIIPLAGTNDFVGIAEIYLGAWSGVLLPTQSIINCRLGNAVASTTGVIRFYFRSV